MSEFFPWHEEQAFFALLSQVQKPGRYTGGEWNACRKDPGKARVRVALVFPDVYEIGMSYLGQKILYDILNSRPDILAERVYAPWPDMEAQLRLRGWPLFSLENRLPLRSFDILGFSLLYELNNSNILTILDLGQIPLHARERKDNDPLVIAGGPAAFNPEPLAPFFDLFFLGDAEEAILEIIQVYQELRSSGAERGTILKRLSRIEGVYVPLFYEPFPGANSPLLAVKSKGDAPRIIRKRVLAPFARAPFPVSIIVPNIQVIHDRVAMEVARGCPQKCRFCQATTLYFPFRVRDPGKVFETMLSSLKVTGYEDASLAALSISDYPYFEDLVNCLMTEFEERRISLSLSSLRPAGLTSEVVKNIVRVRKTGFTIVPEAGTERLRRVINKNLQDEDVLRAAELAFSRGWRLLKLYFMIGLPTETGEDLDGIVRLTGEIIHLGHKILHRPPQINLSLSPFIPKPHTPFQWLPMASPRELKEKLAYLQSRLKRFASVRIKDRPMEMVLLEAVFSRGDRRLAEVLEQAWKRGARFDSWIDHFRFSLWEESFRSLGLSMENYLGPLDLEAELPWDHCYPGIKKQHLREELAKAWRAEPTPSCLKANCGACQGCEMPGLVDRKFPPFSGGQDASSRKKERQKVSSGLGHRYLVFYEKRNLARFLSHLDTMSAISRALRRAGIPVAYSEGFHPKMLLSFPPALALGMEGYNECFELRTPEPCRAESFLPEVNGCLPSGIRVLALKEVPANVPSLSQRLRAAIYSFDVSLPEVRQVVESKMGGEKLGEKELAGWLEERIREVFPSLEKGERVWLGTSPLKIFFKVPANSSRLKPQDFLEKHLGLSGTSFYLIRERFVFQGEEEN